MSKILVLSIGPAPTPEQKNVEGGGLRAWGLAKGLLANDAQNSVTVCYNAGYKNDKSFSSFEGVNIEYWNNDNLAEIIKEFDSIVVSYNAGDLTRIVVENIREDQQLIFDCYVPIYIEVSARNSRDIQREYDSFMPDVKRWGWALERGDIFICANQKQKEWYYGVLAALGRINPKTYSDDELIQIVPYGVYRDAPVVNSTPVTDLLEDKTALKVLWFGGIYPWFDLKSLIDAIYEVAGQTPIELAMVGVMNPFNSHPDFVAKYEEVMDYIVQKDTKGLIHIAGWVPFQERANWYLDSDVVVLINKEGIENKYAWRTRLVDYVWADLPILTNGGDPLSDILQQNNALIKMPDASEPSIRQALLDIASRRIDTSVQKENLKKVRETLYWDVCTANLSNLINLNYRPKDYKTTDLTPVKLDGQLAPAVQEPVYAKNAAQALRMYGVKHCAKKALQKFSKPEPQISQPIPTEPRLIILSHLLNYSGAPLVLMDLVKCLVNTAPEVASKTVFWSFNVVKRNLFAEIKKLGLKSVEERMPYDELKFNQGDVLIINSLFYPEGAIDRILYNLEQGTIKHVHWYAHEDDASIFIRNVPYNPIKNRITKLICEDKITMYNVSKGTLNKYCSYFNNDKNVRLLPYRLQVDRETFFSREASDFEQVRFTNVGTVSDGRKGQLPVIYAFLMFYNDYYKVNPEKYRDFLLTIVGLDDSSLAIQIQKAGRLLDEHFKVYEYTNYEDGLKIIKDSNFHICYSLNESLPLTVYEAMAFGQPIIRDEASGVDEQLEEGKNGWFVSMDDWYSLVTTIEEVLNKEKTSNEKLAQMSKRSTEIALEATKEDYKLLIDAVRGSV